MEADGVEVPLTCAWMPKAACEPILELADWILHAVATQVRSNGTRAASFTADFCAAFHAVDPRLASYIEMTSAFPSVAKRVW